VSVWKEGCGKNTEQMQSWINEYVDGEEDGGIKKKTSGVKKEENVR
jgi:hypothetical protein